MMAACANCPTWEWCQRHGCLAFNPESKKRFEDYGAALAPLMDEIEVALKDAEE